MINAAGIGGEITAAVHSKDFEVGMALKHAVEDKVVQRDAGIERIADDVVEVITAQPIGVRKSVGMKDDQHAELLGLGPERAQTSDLKALGRRRLSGSVRP